MQARETNVDRAFFVFNFKPNKMKREAETKTKDEVVYSPVEDNSKDINKSSIWKNAWHRDEITPEAIRRYPNWWEYHVRFDGLKPIQLLKMQKVLL